MSDKLDHTVLECHLLKVTPSEYRNMLLLYDESVNLASSNEI